MAEHNSCDSSVALDTGYANLSPIPVVFSRAKISHNVFT